jgi:hypothetical protein
MHRNRMLQFAHMKIVEAISGMIRSYTFVFSTALPGLATPLEGLIEAMSENRPCGVHCSTEQGDVVK